MQRVNCYVRIPTRCMRRLYVGVHWIAVAREGFTTPLLHSHCWPPPRCHIRTVGIRTVDPFALVSFALLASHWCRSHCCLSHCCRDTLESEGSEKEGRNARWGTSRASRASKLGSKESHPPKKTSDEKKLDDPAIFRCENIENLRSHTHTHRSGELI